MHAKCSYRERPNGPCVLGVERPNGPKPPKRLGDNVTQSVAAFCMHLQPPYRWRIMQLQTQGEAQRARVPSLLLPWSLSDLLVLVY